MFVTLKGSVEAKGTESLDQTFGIVFFEAKDQSAATEFMNGVPACSSRRGDDR
jgi:hypothetical protein